MKLVIRPGRCTTTTDDGWNELISPGNR